MTSTRKLGQQQLEIDYRRNERDKFLLLVTAIEQRLAQQQQQLTAGAAGATGRPHPAAGGPE